MFSSTIYKDLQDDSRAHVAMDVENRRLKQENSRLQEELSQCQVDKEFVWSLWKKLQAASPDMTETVALIVERERHKAEVKDGKILDILKLKDARISELEFANQDLIQRFNYVNQQKVKLHDEIAHYQAENTKVAGDLSELKQLMTEENSQYQAERSKLIMSIDELNKTNERLQNELHSRDEKLKYVENLNRKQEETVEELREGNSNLQSKIQKIEDKDAKLIQLSRRYEDQTMKITSELKVKTKELVGTRRELEDLRSTHQQCEINTAHREAIIKQLEQLQSSTEKALKDYEAGGIDYQTAQLQINRELHKELSAVKIEASELARQVETLEEALTKSNNEKVMIAEQFRNDQEEFASQLENVVRENEELKDRLCDKNRVISDLSEAVQRLQGHQESLSDFEPRNPVRSKSDSRCDTCDDMQLKRRCHLAESKAEELEIKLELKERVLNDLRQAQQRRLARLKNLLTSYKLVKKQLKVAEEELGRPVNKRKQKLTKPSSKQLQKEENRESLWNELQLTKTENKNLKLVKMNLEELVDDLRVQSSEDAANTYSLRVQIETLQADLAAIKCQNRNVVRSDKATKEEIDAIERKLLASKTTVGSLERRLAEINSDNTVLVEENKSYKREINLLKRNIHKKTRQITDLRAEANRLKRHLRKSTRSSKSDYTSPIAKRYQAVLSESLKTMNDALNIADRSIAHDISAPPYVKDSIQEITTPPLEVDISSQPSDNPPDTDMAPSEIGSLGEEIVRKAVEVRSEETQTSYITPLSRSRSRSRSRPRSDQIPVVSKRDVGTSMKPVKLTTNRLRPTTAFTQVSSLKQRLVSLQIKVKTLTAARDEARQNLGEMSSQNEELEQQIAAANTKVTLQKNTLKNLQVELKDTKALVQQLKSINSDSISKQQAEQEKKSIEVKLKSLTQEATRQCGEIKSLKLELEAAKESNTNLSNKVIRMERDIAQKRTLLEELRLKIKLSNESAQSNLEQLEEKTRELEKMKTVLAQNKTALESAKTSVRVLTSGKKEYETRLCSLQEVLDKKDKLISTLQEQVKSSKSELDSLQDAARQQLVTIATQGENAVSIAQTQLQNANQIIEQFELLMKGLSDALIHRHKALLLQQHYANHIAQKRKSHDVDVESSALNFAKKKAQQILSLSEADVNSLLDSDDDDFSDDDEVHNAVNKEASKWKKRWEMALAQKNFVKKVTDLFLKKIDELTSLNQSH